MARCWERRVASLVVLCLCTAGLEGARPAGGPGFTYHPVTCVPTVTFCAPYTRRNNCVVRNCGNRVSGSVSGSASGSSGTNILISGRFVPKYTGRFSTWRGLRYGKCNELQVFRFQGA
jgi:hypothetical protein